jgi:hypothetical protein
MVPAMNHVIKFFRNVSVSKAVPMNIMRIQKVFNTGLKKLFGTAAS